jgi:hypothetical protein
MLILPSLLWYNRFMTDKLSLELYDSEDLNLNLISLTDEVTILQIISDVMYSRGPGSSRMTLQEACEINGISYATWKDWARRGKILAPLRKARRALDQVFHDLVISHHEQLVQAFFNMALGNSSDGEADVRISPKLQAELLKFYFTKLMPPSVLGTVDVPRSEMEHAKTYQPNELIYMPQTIVNVQGNFLYTGNKDRPPSLVVDVDPNETPPED